MAKKEEQGSVFDLLESLEGNLSRTSTRNATLLEALESAEGVGEDDGEAAANLLRTVRARLGAAHGPNAALRRDLTTAAKVFRNKYEEMEESLKESVEEKKKLREERSELEGAQRQLAEERRQLEGLQRKWRQRLDESRREVDQQREKLSVLSERLTAQSSDLQAQRSLAALSSTAFAADAYKEQQHMLQSASEAALAAEAEQLRQQLRAQLVKNVEAENERLRMELARRQKEEQLSLVGQANDKLRSDATKSRQEIVRITKQFDRKTAEANQRLAQMSEELVKAQENAKRFQELLTAERRKQHGLRQALEVQLQKNGQSQLAGLSEEQEASMARAQQAYVHTLAASLSQPGRQGARSPLSVEDVVRKNESLLMEVASLKADIRRLKLENSTLIQQTKAANADARHMRVYVTTSMADRCELQKRLEKADRQYRSLESSLTRQASDWVRGKRQQKDDQSSRRWDQLSHISEVDFLKNTTTRRM